MSAGPPTPAVTPPVVKKRGRTPKVVTPPTTDAKPTPTPSIKGGSEKDSVSRSSTPSSEKPSIKQKAGKPVKVDWRF